RHQRFVVIDADPGLEAAVVGPIVVAGMGADLDAQRGAAADDPDRLADRAGMDTAADVRAVDRGQDLLVVPGALGQVGVQVDEAAHATLSAPSGRPAVGARGRGPAAPPPVTRWRPSRCPAG